ncbi:MAG: cytidylate kinase family protein [Nitrospirae bacterium]|nr:cytidylate kinase family protein [Nitrospirota bacterium]MBF0533492.1 cytidylate kinase family protein [Nitrospirota bacterium]MBF0615984.1 cytidylate kinase family protein [Nitrospirota bacterium]
MAVVMIGGNPYCKGKEVAESVSRNLSYVCIGDEVFSAASDMFGIPEPDIVSALEDSPRFLGMSFTARIKLISCYHSALASLLYKDNVVYYGRYGHLLIQGVSHVLKVYLKSDINVRAELKAKTDTMGVNEAIKRIIKEDKGHSKLNSFFHNTNGNVQNLCDLVIDTGETAEEDATKIISEQALLMRYRATNYSLHCMKNIELSFKVRAALIAINRDVSVRASSGKVFVHIRAAESKRQKLVASISDMVKRIRDVARVEVIVTEDIFQKYAETYR